MIGTIQERKDRAEAHRRHQIEIGKKLHELVKKGYTNAVIANELGIAENTVRHIRSNMEGGKYVN